MNDQPREQSSAPPSGATNPLLRYSLTGRGGELEARALSQRPVLGNVSLAGEIGIWYAPPNSGKTLIALHLAMEAAAAKRVAPHDIFYVNVDDSTAGVAAKMKALDDYGIHGLAEGERGFRAANLVPAIEDMIDGGTAHGKLIILDTLKKFTDLMSKKDSATFGKVARRFAMSNGSIVALAHTNKHRGANQKLIYAGTSDFFGTATAATISTSGRRRRANASSSSSASRAGAVRLSVPSTPTPPGPA
jgi:RecA-family ATPase